MSYSTRVSELLHNVHANEGDTLTLAKQGREYTGVLMPHHAFSDPEVIVLKMKSGYNIGVRITEDARLSKQGAATEKRHRHRVAGLKPGGKKSVAVLGTGGTIASYVDYRTGAVHPALSADDLVSAVPEMAEICNIDAKVLFSIFSENMRVENWQAIAAAVADRLDKGDEGCIIPHGTDTMGYTSAALSFMLEDLPRPVVLVGAQRSSDRPSSDAYTNLLASARFCVESDAAEVFVLMHQTPSDTMAAVHRGTRVRKMHASRRDAFESVNASPVARMAFEGELTMLAPHKKKHAGKVVLKPDMEPSVGLLFFYPGMSHSIFEQVMLKHRGMVIAGTGLGHVSADMVHSIKAAVKQGIKVVMTSQCLWGRVNLNVYDTGRDLLTAGVIPGEDMLPETAYIKLMWVLANSRNDEEATRLMTTDLRGEMADRRELDG